jgi:diphthine-ammonia ligase
MASTNSLKVIALISGGKDSLFSILHCLALGHEVIALANLYPAPPDPDGKSCGQEDEDINSYMYQTVGHSVIPLYAEALDVPLYREPILGSAANTNRDYAPAAGISSLSPSSEQQDETESLLPLLQRILAAYPSANALSTGAILSTYQRTRIESIALRLGLTPLSYLWQYPYLPPYRHASLLEDMAAVGMDARLIKVASAGLDERVLWQNIADPKVWARGRRGMERFGGERGLEVGAVLGEGGEFETLALDGPGPLWKRRIEVKGVETVLGDGGSAAVRLKGAKLVEKEVGDADLHEMLKSLRVPKLFDDEFERLLQSISESSLTATSTEETAPTSLRSSPEIPLPTTTSRQGNIVLISNLTSISTSTSARDQMLAIATQLTALLSTQYNTTCSSIAFSILLLRQMSDFAAVNAVYSSMFDQPLPPARVTVACGNTMPTDINVMLSVFVDLDFRTRAVPKGLHVQSRSYWAPANIGPYSQAIAVPLSALSSRPLALREKDNTEEESQADKSELVFIAGQISLVPSTMNIFKFDDFNFHDIAASLASTSDHDFVLQTVLSLQHLWRIGRAMNVKWWTSGIAFLSRSSPEHGQQNAVTASKAWKAIHEHLWKTWKNSLVQNSDDDDEDIDVWDLKNRVGSTALSSSHEDDTRVGLDLPCFSVVEGAKDSDVAPIPPIFVVEVDSLPRGAAIEWCSAGLAIPNSLFSRIRVQNVSANSHLTEVGQRNGERTRLTTLAIPKGRELNAEIDEMVSFAGKDGLNTVYMSERDSDWAKRLNAQVVPCWRIWNGEGEELGPLAVGIEYSGDER